MASDTHQHRNLIDDILDLGLILGGLLYFLFAHRVGLEFTDTELAAIASSGAAMRILVRKILMRLWGPKINALEAASPDAPAEPAEPEATPSETPTAASEVPPPADDDAGDSPIIPPPPNVGG